MNRPCLVLALIVTFSGTPLRLAEAASDLARSLPGPDVVGEIEEIDGGVGDDKGETIKADPAYSSLDAMAMVGELASCFVSTKLPPLPPSPAVFRPSDSIPVSPRRHALLQRYQC